MVAAVSGIGIDSELRVIYDAYHGRSVPGRKDVDVLDQIAGVTAGWILAIIPDSR
jgi:hypothetical protein